jgi:protein Tex
MSTTEVEVMARSIDLARIASELKLKESQVVSVVELLDNDNTIPFITRYRKEQTGHLNEDQLRAIQKRVRAARQLLEKASNILRLIDGQGKLTDKLRKQIEEAETLKRLDDLYLPYRQKRKSRAEAARQRGLDPFADAIWNGDAAVSDLETSATSYIDAEKELPTTAEVLQGASDIIAERISEDVAIRDLSRKIGWRTGRLSVSAAKSAKETGKEFQNYLGYEEPVWKVPAHRALALNRGEKTGVLRVKFEWDRELACRNIASHYELDEHLFGEFVSRCARDGLERLVHPSIEREVRRELTETAEEHGIGVFAKNLRSLLLQPPMRDQRVLAIDPGFRTGCKIAVLDEVGQCLHHDVIYLSTGDKRAAGIEKLKGLITEHECQQVAIGNGTACRETEELISEMIADHCPDCRYLIVNEAGASIYSTSVTAGEEFPDLDATVRGTISIGRRLQDPLSELVKIEAQHIGVGMYQHDMSPKLMKDSLDGVVESCVNYVGVDLNTASSSLLRYVSGFNQGIARRVTEWREANGRFASRSQLLGVAGIGEATYTQAAGFLKIGNGDDPLDNTWIHPESYSIATQLLERAGVTSAELMSDNEQREGLCHKIQSLPLKKLSKEWGIATSVLKDIVDALVRPGRDPRSDLPGPIFKQGVLKLKDLAPGMELNGSVLNVVDFGAFVDVGLKNSGLVHVSQLADRFIKSPHDIVSVGDLVNVWVQKVDLERERVALTMIKPRK